MQSRRNLGRPPPPQIFSDQLTLSQLEGWGQIMTPGLSGLPTAVLTQIRYEIQHRVRLPTSLAKREDICHFAEVRSHMLFCLPMNRELNYYILLMLVSSVRIAKKNQLRLRSSQKALLATVCIRTVSS